MAKSKCKISCIFVEKNTKFTLSSTQNLFDLYCYTMLNLYWTYSKDNKQEKYIFYTDNGWFCLSTSKHTYAVFRHKIVYFFASYIRTSGQNVLKTSQDTYLNHPLHENINISNIFEKNIFWLFSWPSQNVNILYFRWKNTKFTISSTQILVDLYCYTI